MSSDNPDLILGKYIRIGFVLEYLPELAQCMIEIQEPMHHKYTIGQHCLLTCKYAPKNNLTLRLAALFHDLGKLHTRKKIGGKLTYHMHEYASARIAKDRLKRLGFSPKVINEVCFLIVNHMYYYDRKWNDSTVRKFIKKMGITKDTNLDEVPVFILRQCDRKATGLKVPISQKQKDFQARIKRILNEESNNN